MVQVYLLFIITNMSCDIKTFQIRVNTDHVSWQVWRGVLDMVFFIIFKRVKFSGFDLYWQLKPDVVVSVSLGDFTLTTPPFLTIHSCAVLH